MTQDKTNPRKHLTDKERKSKPKRPPRGAVTQRRSGMWKALLVIDGVKCSLGYHKTREAAQEAYWEAMKCVDT